MTPKRRVYFSIDVETDGPTPGLNSMLELGCAAFQGGSTEPIATFTRILRPLLEARADMLTIEKFWAMHPEKWRRLEENQVDPCEAMKDYVVWVENVVRSALRVAAAWPASWDWAFVFYYLQRYGLKSPFGHSAMDIKTLAMAWHKRGFVSKKRAKLPKAWSEGCKHTHVALEDAIEQGKVMVHLLWELGLEQPANEETP